MAEAGAALRERVAATKLTLGRVDGRLAFEIGRQFGFRLRPLRVIRPQDLLVLEFQFVNMQRQGERLVRVNPSQPAYLIAVHQPQSFGEEAYPELSDQGGPNGPANDPNLSGYKPPKPVSAVTAPPVSQARVRIGGRSRTAHEMPAGVTGVDRTLPALLTALREWPLFLDGSAQPDSGGYKWQAGVRVGWLSRDLRQSANIAREALGANVERAGLDRAALEIAQISVTNALRGASADGDRLRRLADNAVRRAVPGGARDGEVRIDQVVAAVYVRAQAGRRALAQVGRGRVGDVFALDRLPPQIFAEFLKPDPPSDHETAIEMPYRLIGSPLKTAGFDHALTPVAHGKRTELWHSRMGTRTVRAGGVTIDDRPGAASDDGGWDGEKLRFIWSPDYRDGTHDVFNKSLDHLDRQMLVKLTAGFNEKKQDGVSKFTPRAVFVRRLMLTALGGDLEAHRKFDPRPAGVDLSAWSHRAAIGRDYFTRVEYSGFLFPFGHRATLVKLTERKFEWRAPQDRVAFLRQRFFIIVRDRMIEYPGASPQPHEGRSFPFERVICGVDVTPDLAPPGSDPDDRIASVTGNSDPALFRMAFWPSRGNDQDYRFPMVGIDAAGRKVAFEMPLIFISELKNIKDEIGKIAVHWNGGGKSTTRRTPSLAGQTVRMAPAEVGAGDVDLPLVQGEIRAVAPTSALKTTPQPMLQQFPRLGQAVAKLAAVERLTGVSREEKIEFYQPFLNNGLTGGAVFARIVGATKLAFGSGNPSSSVGGIATPDLTPTGLSARHGLASGSLGDFDAGKFKPESFFPDAKLLGFFSLKTLLKALDLGDGGDTPKITTLELPDRIQTRFKLVQDLDSGEPLPGLILGAGGQTRFTLDTLVDAPLTGEPPTSSVTGELTNFKISFLGALLIHFDRLRFFTQPGQKPDVDVDLNPKTGVMFGGPLEFVNRLRDFIPANGFSDPPNLDITPMGITAGYSLGLPPVQVGILALSNISLGASFSLPFTGEAPTARFNFAERHSTFNLTVSMFGGGGFFALVAAADGIREIEAQLEFGAQIAINLGVASGSVYVKGGFYFHYNTDKVKFEGFVELGGRLSVLGLISVSLTFHLGLSYELLQKSGNNGVRASRLFGQATLTVEIEILFFSASVDVTVEKTFVGSEADPTFFQLVPDKALWDEYCAAYA
jgi:hypothetical protein